MRFDTPTIKNPREAERHLHHQLLLYGSIPGIAEREYGISRFFSMGWKQYEGNSLYVSFTKETLETTLIAEATLFQCPDNHAQIDFQSFIRAPDGLVLEFQKFCPAHVFEIESTLLANIEAYINYYPKSDGIEIFRRYRIRSN